MTNHQKNILQIGTTNWQSKEEPTSGSGILHKAHHKELIHLGYQSFSVFPTCSKQYPPSDFVNPFYLEHSIPIFTHIPTSSYRFSDMSNEEFSSYSSRLEDHITTYINFIETTYGEISLCIVHHLFINMIILNRINQKRKATNISPITVWGFAHGTALKLLSDENNIGNIRFLPIVRDAIQETEGIFVISNEQEKIVLDLFYGFYSKPNDYQSNRRRLEKKQREKGSFYGRTAF